jgi:hypothetical protein
MSSYVRAARAESKYTDDPLRTLFAETPETRNLSDARSDAFAAAALEAGFRTPTALNYAEAAVSLAPNRPLGRYVYGNVLYELKGRRVESLDQNWMAYQLAKGKSKQVIYDSGTKGDHLLIDLHPEYTTDGRVIYHPEPYKPDKPVPTPHPKDLNSYLPDPY